jgi:plastocyanin
MSETTKRQFLLALISVAVVGALAFAVAAASKPAAREIVLISRDIAFFLPGDPTPNPTLHVAPGESVRLRLINEDRGMRHDWAAGSLGVATRLLDGDGSADTVEFTAPQERGSHRYVCSTHAALMSGQLEVR